MGLKKNTFDVLRLPAVPCNDNATEFSFLCSFPF